ncbi:hypothetical protein G7K71_11540 [Desulfofundulus sp. TPOSR]|nr:hypothetical protein [Desulfofundulus sp. TPOSR]
MINPVVDLGHKSEIGEKIAAGRASTAEVREYQQAVDETVRQILSLPDDSLFARSKVFLRQPWVNDRRAYVKCACYGEVVAVEKIVLGEGELLCQVCGAKKM